ncbi:MAG: hypothetical protein N5P05_002716 [Chroococcopsis gigantea SAG 12.99]|jgi:uncharacterized protein (DUF1778 family)|nr:hypothetical protein [Chroococcopsis gigantea SAG 12.99]
MREAKKKTTIVGVRLAIEEKRKLQEIASLHYQTISDFIRMNALNLINSERKVVPEINRKLYFELGEISEYIQTMQIVPEERIKLQESLDRIRGELIGLERVREE